MKSENYYQKWRVEQQEKGNLKVSFGDWRQEQIKQKEEKELKKEEAEMVKRLKIAGCSKNLITIARKYKCHKLSKMLMQQAKHNSQEHSLEILIAVIIKNVLKESSMPHFMTKL